MSLVDPRYPVHLQVMSAVHARCADCRAPFLIPYEWGHGPGLLDPHAAGKALLEHAREMPILHPTVLPEHHAIRRSA